MRIRLPRLEDSWRRLVFALFVAGVLWTLSWLGARWLIVSAPLEHADAIVVLSGSSTVTERARHAAKLFSEKRAPKIILTNDNRKGGWSQAEQRNPYFYEIALNELTNLGVSREQIELISAPVASTWDEATLVKQYSQTHNVHSILIVTSSYHSRRALWTFTKVVDGASEVGIDPVETGIQTPSPGTWWLHGKGWSQVFVEYLKLVYYRLRS